MSNLILNQLIKNLEDTVIVSEKNTIAEFDKFVDTGSYTLNALLSGSMYGGMPSNKVICFNGQPTTGKTFFSLSIANYFQEQDDSAVIVLYDTEADKTKKLLLDRGIELDKTVSSSPITIQDFRTNVLNFVEQYLKLPEKDRMPVLMILDSLGQLSSNKEMNDSLEGKESVDLTRARMIKGTFRVIRSKLARANIPLIITNHVYEVIGNMFKTTESSGGSGPRYSSDIIVTLTKSQFKQSNSKEVQGSIIKMILTKSRLTKEKATATTLLRFNGGLDRYYGLLEIAEKHSVIEKSGNRYDINGLKVYESAIYKNPEKYFTPEIMEKLEKACNKEFLYSNSLADYELEYNPVKNKDQS